LHIILLSNKIKKDLNCIFVFPLFITTTTTYQEAKSAHESWKDYYEYLLLLISIPVEEGGIEPSTRRTNVSSFDDILDLAAYA